MRLRLILDDGTPRCLPPWARDEIVGRRLADADRHLPPTVASVEETISLYVYEGQKGDAVTRGIRNAAESIVREFGR